MPILENGTIVVKVLDARAAMATFRDEEIVFVNEVIM